MLKLIKFGVYVAAGVGAYEVLRRTGALQRVGQWLSEQVPDEYQDQARQYVDQARQTAQQYGGQIRERVNQYGERVQDYANQATEAVRSATGYGQPQAAGADQNAGLSQQGGVDGPTSNGRSAGNGYSTGNPGITGPGRGTVSQVDEGTGVHAAHTVAAVKLRPHRTWRRCRLHHPAGLGTSDDPCRQRHQHHRQRRSECHHHRQFRHLHRRQRRQ